jgi:hypothetical protein
MKKLFGRPSPAMVIAVVALIVALGGTAIAGGALNNKKVKNISNNQITQRAPGLSVSHAKTADSATNANTVGGRTVQAAVVSANAGGATVVRGSATGAGRFGTGNYFVSFPTNILNCTYVATDGSTAAGAGPAGEISVEQEDSTHPTDVEIRHFDSGGSLADYAAGQGFHIEVVC